MKMDQQIWQVWASILHRWGLKDLAASLLEAAGPLAVLGAQVVYMGQPLLERVLPLGHMGALASLLEDADQAQAFVTFLREATPQ